MVRLSVQDRDSLAPSIAGGFVLIPIASLMRAWKACRSHPLGIGDFRAWLACWEMTARRQAAFRHAVVGRYSPPSDRGTTYNVAELARLTGVGERRARASVRLLEGNGLIRWSESDLVLTELECVQNTREDTIGRGRAEVVFTQLKVPKNRLEDSIGGGRGSVAIPRRILRLLAGGARPALIATALGMLLRCLSRRKAGFDGRGRVKASWIASVFGVALSRVKAARKELIALGWITPEPGDQWAMNRWGRAYRISLDWAAMIGSPMGPPPTDSGSPVGPLDLYQDLPSGNDKDQEPPRRGGPDGVEVKEQGGATEAAQCEVVRCESAPCEAAPCEAAPCEAAPCEAAPCEAAPCRMEPVAFPVATPSIDGIRPEDLRDTGRLLDLHRQAVSRGLAASSEDGRLKFLAVAEHARVVGTMNPGGLLARLVRRGWWHFATIDDEDTARRRLREYQHRYEEKPKLGVTKSRATSDSETAKSPRALGSLLADLVKIREISLGSSMVQQLAIEPLS
jgi:hypothetical protein